MMIILNCFKVYNAYSQSLYLSVSSLHVGGRRRQTVNIVSKYVYNTAKVVGTKGENWSRMRGSGVWKGLQITQGGEGEWPIQRPKSSL